MLNSLWSQIESVLCNHTERLVIILYCYEELTLKEVGQSLDLPESRVEEILRDLERRLGRPLPSQHSTCETRSS